MPKAVEPTTNEPQQQGAWLVAKSEPAEGSRLALSRELPWAQHVKPALRSGSRKSDDVTTAEIVSYLQGFQIEMRAEARWIFVQAARGGHVVEGCC